MKYLSVLFLFLFLFSCKEERRTVEPFRYEKAGLLVKVTHKTKGAGEGFLVNVYEDKDALKARKPYASGRTGGNGEVQFSDLYVGFFYVDCEVPGDTLYYAVDSVWTTQNIVQSLSLLLEPQP